MNEKRSRDPSYVTEYWDDLCMTGKRGFAATNRRLLRGDSRSSQTFFRDFCYSRSRGGRTNKAKLYIRMLERANRDEYRKLKPDRRLTTDERQLAIDVISFRRKGRGKGLVLDDMPDNRFAAICLNVPVSRIDDVTESLLTPTKDSDWLGE